VEQVLLLRHSEQAEVDKDQLAELYAQLGQDSAEGVVCRAMEEISARINRIEAHFIEQDLDAVAKTVRSIVAMADQLGMHKLSRVAKDFQTAFNRHDIAAMAAVLARLLRVGETSLESIWTTDEPPV